MKNDRRSNAWLDPRFLVQSAVMAVGVWVSVQVRTDRLEQSAEALRAQSSKIESQLTQIVTSVQSLSQTSTALSAELEARGREIDKLQRAIEALQQHDSVQERMLAEMRTTRPGRNQ